MQANTGRKSVSELTGLSRILAEAAWAILREALLTEIGSASWFMVIGANRYPTEQSMVWT